MNNTYLNSINQFFDANEGFKKGNLSKLSYKPYKNYKEKEVVVSNEKEALLLFILKCDLAINDLTLYLDLHEKDQEAVKLLNFYKQEYEKAKKQYLEKYEPLFVCQKTETFKWNVEPFPWEK